MPEEDVFTILAEMPSFRKIGEGAERGTGIRE
jgi:hypothetical protein